MKERELHHHLQHLRQELQYGVVYCTQADDGEWFVMDATDILVNPDSGSVPIEVPENPATP